MTKTSNPLTLLKSLLTVPQPSLNTLLLGRSVETLRDEASHCCFPMNAIDEALCLIDEDLYDRGFAMPQQASWDWLETVNKSVA